MSALIKLLRDAERERDEALVKLDCARTELEGARSTSDYLLDQVNSLRDKADVRLSFAEKRLSEMTVERDELSHKLKGEAAHIKSLEGLLVDAVRERDEARRDFVRVADALGLVSTDDTGRIGAVAPVEEVVKEARLAASALAKQAELFESLSMACETPPEGCDCAGCSYAREKGGDHNT